MKTIEVKLYNFNELSENSKEYAIEQQRESFYNYNDFSYWAIDDCYLLEPNHSELCQIIPNYNEFKKPMIDNNRKIYFDLERYRHINASQAIVINYEKEFLLWLEIPESMHEKIYYKIKSTNDRYPDTIIQFEENDCDYEFTDEENEILEKAADKFSDHMETVLNRIESSIEYYFSDEYISEDLEINYQFTEDGKIFF